MQGRLRGAPLREAAILDNEVKILRSEECVQSRQHRGVFIRVIHECDAFEVLRTEMEPGSAFDNVELGDCRAYHFVLDGSPVFRADQQSTDLMPGDSIMFNHPTPYTISNCAPSRSIVLSILFKTSAMEDA